MNFFFFDFETFLIQPGMQAPPIVCMSYAVNGATPELVHARDPRMALLLDTALCSDAVMVAHYASFEALCTMAHRPEWVALVAAKVERNQFRCTVVREKLLRTGKGDHREGFGLDDCIEAHRLKVAVDKSCPWRLRYGTLWNTPCEEWPTEARHYALSDIAVREVYWAQDKAGPEYFVNEAEQMMAAITLASTQSWGFMTDGETAAILVEETKVRLEEYKQQLLACDPPLLRWEIDAGVPGLVRNTKLAQERCAAAYAKLGREPPRGDLSPTMFQKAFKASGVDGAPEWTPAQKKKVKITPKMKDEAVAAGVDSNLLIGNISVDKDACFLSRDPLLVAYSAYGQADTLLGKAKRPLLAALAGMPIQCSYNGMVKTGRSSCRQGEDPEPGEAWMAYGMQVQNLPRAGEIVEASSDD